jgi:hypothetical protein
LTESKKENFYQFSKHKISTIKRQQFYTHHRKSLRKLAYIHTIEQRSGQFLREQKSSRYTSNITVRSDVANNLQIYQRYISRMIQNQTFGWHLL